MEGDIKKKVKRKKHAKNEKCVKQKFPVSFNLSTSLKRWKSKSISQNIFCCSRIRFELFIIVVVYPFLLRVLLKITRIVQIVYKHFVVRRDLIFMIFQLITN